MKIFKKHNQTEKEIQIPQLSILPGVTVIAVCMVVIFAVLFLFLWRSENIILYFGGFFSTSSKQSANGDALAGGVSLPEETGMIFSEDNFFTPDFSGAAETVNGMVELLRTVRRCDSYKQNFLISYRAGSSEVVSVMRDGDKYRIESSDVLIICDGHIVYMCRYVDGDIAFTNRWNREEGTFTYESEIGIPSLDTVIGWMEYAEEMPELTFDERKKTVSLTGIASEGFVRAVTLTYETGMILYASNETSNGELLMQCESMFYTIEPDFSKDTFLVPMT